MSFSLCSNCNTFDCDDGVWDDKYWAVFRDTTIVVADKFRNDYCVPTAIYFPPITKTDAREDDTSNGDASLPNSGVIIGQNAIKSVAKDAENVIFDIKRIIGRQRGDTQLQLFNESHQFDIVFESENDEYPTIRVPNRNNLLITPEQALAVILAHLVEMVSL